MRLEFFKAMVEAEVNFEILTYKEQIELIQKLIKDHELMFPYHKLLLMEQRETDGSLDW